MSSSGGGGVGGVVHLAARAGVRDSIHAPEAYINTNVQGARRGGGCGGKMDNQTNNVQRCAFYNCDYDWA